MIDEIATLIVSSKEAPEQSSVAVLTTLDFAEEMRERIGRDKVDDDGAQDGPEEEEDRKVPFPKYEGRSCPFGGNGWGLRR